MTTFTRWKHHSVCPKQRNEHGLHLKSCSFLSFSIQKHQARQIPCIYCYLIAAWHYRNDISAHNLNSNALNVRCVSSIIEYNRDFSYRTSSYAHLKEEQYKKKNWLWYRGWKKICYQAVAAAYQFDWFRGQHIINNKIVYSIPSGIWPRIYVQCLQHWARKRRINTCFMVSFQWLTTKRRNCCRILSGDT